MNPNQIVSETKTKLDQATFHFKDELRKLRTGRAHPSMLDSVMVEAYGQAMPLKSIASIAVPEPQLLQITPFDPNNLQPIADAIRNDQSLGLTPTDDGRVVRVNLPPMTTENRQDMVKILHQKVEECLISARNARHEAFHRGEQAEKDKDIGKDERLRFEKQVDELLTKQKNEVDELAKAKEEEILTV
ncbi:MAG TPA: ribosome recycling factor [Candidatus Saccharimonadales bacterium]|nr:ribosome recycling factor [Candidatus Saccharimonadales bacterium]